MINRQDFSVRKPAVMAAVDPVEISLIVPALNESGGITDTLQALQHMRRRGVEIIVADGGSTDTTVAVCEPLADRVISTAAGRARQMQAGAVLARGSILWFLHADTRAPRDADRAIAAALGAGDCQWGRFDVGFPQAGLMLGVVAVLMNLRSRLTGIASGDQGIFVTRKLFERVNGYPQIPLMEDIALSRLLKHHSRPACLHDKLITSARRWQTHGTLRTILVMWSLRLAYFLGASPARLAQFYKPH
jgi:rSAM/selenodomain-associated transferase 2